MSQPSDLTVSLPPGVTGVAVFDGTEVLLLLDKDATAGWEFTNPVSAEILTARLRAWANFIEWRAAATSEVRR